MNISLLVLIVYIAITVGISLYFATKNNSLKQFSVADSGLGVPLIVALLFSELIAGAGTIGNAAEAFESGVSSVWANWGMAIGCVLFLLLAAKFYRAMCKTHGVVSIPEAYRLLFDSRCRTVLLVIVVVVYGIIYSSQPMAAASMLAPLLKIDTVIVSWIMAGIFVLITLFGGLKGIAWMNFVHAAVMYIGMIIVAVKSLSTVGGIDALQASLPSHFFDFGQPNWPTVIAYALGTGISFLASSTIVSATYAAKSTRTCNKGIIISAVLIIPFALAPAVIGMCAKVYDPSISANSALFQMSDKLGVGFSALTSTAVMAAIASTAPALLIAVSTALGRDFYKGIIRQKATDREQLLFTKAMAIVVGFGANFFGLHTSSILNQMLGAFQIRSVVGIVLIAAIFWPRVTASAAFWSMLFGGTVAAVWHFGGNPGGIAPLWPAAAVCLIVLVSVTLRSKEKVSPGHLLYRQALQDMKTAESHIGVNGEAASIMPEDGPTEL